MGVSDLMACAHSSMSVSQAASSSAPDLILIRTLLSS